MGLPFVALAKNGAHRTALAGDQGMDPRRRAGPRLVQPSPASLQSRSRRFRPAPDVASRGNTIGRRPHSGSRIHLTPTIGQKTTAAKNFLAKRVGKLCSLQMNFAVKPQTPAKTRRRIGIFLTETPPIASLKHLFRSLFPALRSSPTAVSGASRQKQIPSNSHTQHIMAQKHMHFLVGLKEDPTELKFKL